MPCNDDCNETCPEHEREPRVLASPITEEDKTAAMEYIEELFGIEPGSPPKQLDEASPITELDKKLIMWHVDELFML